MKLRAIRLHNVRRFANEGVAIEGIDEGVNVLSAENEFGKSTVFDAVHALFFQAHKAKANAAIKNLRPYSGGAITVEVEVDTPEGAFRIRKRWLGSAQSQVFETTSGRIVAQADEADQWIDGKIRGGATGPAGLLWVQQGVVEMGRGSGKIAETEKSAREDVLSSVAGEIETLTGGRRTTQVLAKCSAELDEFVTATGKPKKTGPFGIALEEYDALTLQVEELSGRVDDLRGDLDRRTRERKHLAELQDAEVLARDAKALEAADTALKAGETQAGELQKAELTEKLAQQERDDAKGKLERFDAARAVVGDLQKRIVAERAARDDVAARHTEAKQTEEEAVAGIGDCRSKLLQAEADLSVANKAVAAQEAASRLEARQKTFADADAAHRAVETARAKARALDLPPEKIAALEKLEDRIATLTAEKRASTISVRADYRQSDSGLIRANGVTLTDGTDASVERTTRFEIEGVGTLTVSPGAGSRTDDLDRNLAEAAEQLTAGLTTLGVASLGAAHAQRAEVVEHVRDAERNEARRDALAPEGLDVLRAEIESLSRKVVEAPAVTESVEGCTARRDAARQARDAAEEVATSAISAFGELDRKLATAEANLRGLTENLARAMADLDQDTEVETAQQRLASILSEKSVSFETAHRVAEDLRKNTPDLESLKAARKRAAGVVEETRKETEALSGSIRELTGRITTLADEGIEEELASAEGRRDRAKQRVDELETEVATLQRLRDVLTDAKADAKEHFFEPVVKELRPLLGIVFGDATVTFDEVTMLPVTVERNGAIENFDALSGGMREQITVLTRLAFARLLARDGRTVPVILDDALIYSDDERIERMFNALHRHADDLQILVFTCRQRAFQRLGGRSLSMQTWTPES